ncbi:hypothetical protein [Aeromicrobium sp. Sec7.5]|uniref:hypothetical protein n=1 Tax=Aeromicrobium sp. Sec7.5 TaxID=3121276 RepID=UPI002FE482F8
MGAVALTVQGSVMTSNAITPSCRINGYPVKVRYGENLIPVPAGPARVDLSAQWLRTYGQAALEFQVQPGQTVPVFYAAPMHQFTTGTIGHAKVKRKGVVPFVIIMAAILAIAVTVAVGAIVGA